ncbi:LysR family transcriptional regulator [Labrys miyagiensis]
MNFRAFDLNLLRVLDGMLAERNTTRVAQSAGLSQPAVSAALRRLREALGDPLFVREGHLLVPTAFARSLEAPVRAALANLEHALCGGTPFDPLTCTRSFTIAGSDFLNEMLMPKLADTVQRVAPNMRLKLLPADPDSLLGMISAGRLDLALSVPQPQPDWIEKSLAFQMSSVAVARDNHPAIREAGLEWGDVLPLDLFCTLGHAIFSVTDDYERQEDPILGSFGRQRHVAVSVPGFHGVGRVVAQSDLLGVLPVRFALSVAGQLGLQVYRLPFDMPLKQAFLYWHKRESANHQHVWLRNTVLHLLAPLDEVRNPLRANEFLAKPAA